MMVDEEAIDSANEVLHPEFMASCFAAEPWQRGFFLFWHKRNKRFLLFFFELAKKEKKQKKKATPSQERHFHVNRSLHAEVLLFEILLKHLFK